MEIITPIKFVVNKNTNKKRILTSNREVIANKLHQDFKSKLVYEGSPDENLKEIRSKLKKNPESTFQIRGNNIYEIRKKITKIDTINYTILETIKILQERNLISGDVNELYKLVFNCFHDGSEKIKYIIKS